VPPLDAAAFLTRAKLRSGGAWASWKLAIYLEPCVYCGRMPNHDGTREHLTPIVAGGGNDWENLAPACQACNSRRGHGSILLFLVKRRGWLMNRRYHARAAAEIKLRRKYGKWLPKYNRICYALPVSMTQTERARTHTMRILAIDLTNFGCFQSFRLAFTEPRTLILGPNGIGKSTILDAIALCLLGRCRGTDARGAGQARLVGAGGTSARLKLETSFGEILREITPKGNSANMSPQAIADKLGVTDGMIEALVYGQTFFEHDHAAASAMLLRLLKVQATPEELPGCGVTEPIDFEKMVALYDEAYKARPMLKRTRDAIQVPALPSVVPFVSEGAEASLASQRESLQALDERIGGLDSTRKRLTADIATAAAEQAGDSLEKRRGKLETLQGLLEESIAAEAKASAALQAHRTQAPAFEVKQAQDTQSQRSALVLRIIDHNPERGCVLDAGIPCLTSAAKFGGYVEGLKAQNLELQHRIDDAQIWASQLVELETTHRQTVRDVEYSRNRFDEAAASVQAYETAVSTLHGRQEAAAETDQALANSRESRAARQAQIDALDEQVKAASAYQSIKAVRDRMQTAYDAAAKDVEACEAKVKLLGPKGVRLTKLTSALDTFHEAINARLQPFGFQLAFQVDPWEVQVAHGGTVTPFERLSKGERAWTAAAFQLALAEVSGLGFCCIDDLEAVVNHSTWLQARKLLTGMIMSAAVGQVVIAMAKGDQDGADPQGAGLQVVRMDRGRAAVA